MINQSWWNRYPCMNCGYNVVVTQAIRIDCDYWYYCSNKTCKNHDPGEQLGDMEVCSFFDITSGPDKQPATEAPIEDDEWVGFPPPKSVTEVLLRYPDWPWEVLNLDDLENHDYRIVRVAPTVDRTMIIWIKNSVITPEEGIAK